MLLSCMNKIIYNVNLSNVHNIVMEKIYTAGICEKTAQAFCDPHLMHSLSSLITDQNDYNNYTMSRTIMFIRMQCV